MTRGCQGPAQDCLSLNEEDTHGGARSKVPVDAAVPEVVVLDEAEPLLVHLPEGPKRSEPMGLASSNVGRAVLPDAEKKEADEQ